MEQQTAARSLRREKECSLHNLIENLSSNFSESATKKRNIIINDVHSDLALNGDVPLLQRLVSKIIQLINGITKNNTISISAKSYSDVVLLHFKETNLQNFSRLFDGLKQMHDEAEKLGGFLGVTSQQGVETTIALMFINVKQTPENYFSNLLKTVTAMRQVSE